MIVVADASPVIFLAKIRQLGLVRVVLGGDVRLPRAVFDEILAGPVDPVERQILEEFLAGCRIEPVKKPRRFATAMSAADNAALTLAVRRKAAVLLCDDRITRRMAEMEGVRPLGTLGVLLRAARAGALSRAEARRLVDLLVSAHGFRVGVEVYQAVLAALAQGGRR